jgi:hypothetical protein
MWTVGCEKRCSSVPDLAGRKGSGSRLLALFVSALVPCLGASGCQCVGGIDKRYVDPSLYATEGGTDAPEGCTFEEQGSAAVRFVHAVPGFERVDLCVRAAGVGSWSGRPVTRGVGTECPVGVGYKQVTAPRTLPTGNVDLKVIASSDENCQAAAIAELPSVALSDGVTTVIHASSGDVGALFALPESPAVASSALVRFVHVLDGVDRLDVYQPDMAQWPPGLGVKTLAEIEFGGVAAQGDAGVFDVDSNGYMSFYYPSSVQTFGALDSSWEAEGPGTEPPPWIAVAQRAWTSREAFSVFAVGRADDPAFPPELVDCRESNDDGLWTLCGDAHDISVSVLHTTLSGADYPHYKVRAEQMGPVVAGADTDVLCLGFVMSDDDKRTIEEVSREAGFNVAWAETDLDTAIDDPRRSDGTVPDPPTTPPCEGEDSLAVVDEVLDCLGVHCTGGNGRDGGIDSTACMAGKCLLPLLSALTKPEPQQRCVMCLAFTMLDGSPLDRVEELCTTNRAAGMAFEGKSGVMLLSRFPMRDVKHVVLPSWVWRASVTKATVDLPSEQAVDVYCTQLSTPERAANFPYLGPYGAGEEGTSPWTHEALLQAKQVEELVKRQSGPRPAVVVGALETSPPCPACQPPIDPFGPEVLTDLLLHFGLGTAQDYTWQCLECGDNPLRALEGRTDASLWTDHLLLRGIAKSDVVGTRRTFEDLVMTIPVDGGNVAVPPSSHYGLRSVLRIR